MLLCKIGQYIFSEKKLLNELSYSGASYLMSELIRSQTLIQ